MRRVSRGIPSTTLTSSFKEVSHLSWVGAEGSQARETPPGEHLVPAAYKCVLIAPRLQAGNLLAHRGRHEHDSQMVASVDLCVTSRKPSGSATSKIEARHEDRWEHKYTAPARYSERESIIEYLTSQHRSAVPSVQHSGRKQCCGWLAGCWKDCSEMVGCTLTGGGTGLNTKYAFTC